MARGVALDRRIGSLLGIHHQIVRPMNLRDEQVGKFQAEL